MRALLPIMATLALLAGCAPGAGPVATEVASAASQELARRPQDYTNGQARAFLVSRDGRVRGLLWGTMHIGYGEATALPRPVRAMFARAADLHVETAMDQVPEADMDRLRDAVRPRFDGDALARLDPTTRAAAARITSPDGSVAHSSLRQLSRLLTEAAAAGPSGPLPELGIVDVDLIGFARSTGKPVAGLETLSDVLPLAASDPNGEDAAAELRQAVRRQDGLRAFATWVRAAYASGQVSQVLAALVAWRADTADLRRNDAGRPALFTGRNRAWMGELERSFGADGFHFVAFGAGHLVGEDGVVSLLRARGWTVMPCVADACAN